MNFMARDIFVPEDFFGFICLNDKICLFSTAKLIANAMAIGFYKEEPPNRHELMFQGGQIAIMTMRLWFLEISQHRLVRH